MSRITIASMPLVYRYTIFCGKGKYHATSKALKQTYLFSPARRRVVVSCMQKYQSPPCRAKETPLSIAKWPRILLTPNDARPRPPLQTQPTRPSRFLHNITQLDVSCIPCLISLLCSLSQSLQRGYPILLLTRGMALHLYTFSRILPPCCLAR
jgi:hypothetical protein